MLLCGSLGCTEDSKSDTPTAAEALESWCNDYCSWAETCGVLDYSTCNSNCWLNGGYQSYGEQTYYLAMGECLSEDVTCSGGSDESWSGCYEEVSVALEPRQSIYDLCDALGPVILSCGDRYATDTCARSFSFLSDEAAARVAAACADSNCDTLSDCISNAY